MNDGKGWIPIGTNNSNRPFRGVFDGNSKVITGLYINNSAQYGVGVFGYVANTTIINLGVENVNITGLNVGAGGMIGYTYTNNSISNCYATGSVSGSSNVGGLVGRARGSISNCYFSGSVTGDTDVGGLVGYTNELSIVNCYSTGSVTGGGEETGGLVGYFEGSGIVANCYSTANISGSYFAGGLIGVGHVYGSIVISNCVAANSTITGPYCGRIVGDDDFGGVLINNYANEAMLVNGATVSGGTLNNQNGANVPIASLTSLNFYNSPSNWHTASWDIGSTKSIWAICEEESLPHLNWQNIECSMFIPVGNITGIPTTAIAGTPLTLTGAIFPGNATFQSIVWSVQTAGTTGATISPAGGSGEWIFTATSTGTATIRATIANGTAVGTPYTKDFTITVASNNFCGGNGTSGNPYLICTADELAQLATLVNAGNWNYHDKHYKLNNDIDLSAYGETWNDGKGWIPIGTWLSSNSYTFQGVFDGNGKVITGLYINNTTQNFVGLFARAYEGTIMNLGVENVNITGGERTGGLVGSANYSNISNCYTTGSVSGTTGVGGFVGYAGGSQATSSIFNCYSTCNVTGGDITGGFVGDQQQVVLSYCYATGNVNGQSNVGGLAGQNLFGSLRYCIAANTAITGSTRVNRIAGVESNNTLTNNYANETMLVNGVTVSNGTLNNSNGANVSQTSLTSLNFYNSSTNWNTAPWDIGTSTSVWTICEKESLPHLSWQDIECTLFCDGDGTETNPYLICTADDLALLATFVNDGNPNFNNKYYKLNNDIDLSDYGATWNDGKGWIPIGINLSASFKGIFDGNGKVITGLFINNTVQDNAGLFGFVDAGIIMNLGVENVNITARQYTGGLVAYTRSSNISNSYTTGTVSGTTGVGGFAGYTVGSLANSIIANCYSTCHVIGSSTNIGGFVGDNRANLSYCYSTGNVSGLNVVGGFVGQSISGTIRNCVAANKVITGTGANVNRIYGTASGTFANNYANEAMLVKGVKVSGGALNNANGADVSLTSLASLNFYNTPSNWHTAPWDIGAYTTIWSICEYLSLPYLTWQDINCATFPFIAVTNITDVLETAYPNISLKLTGTVVPSDATNYTITWSMVDAGTTGATISPAGWGGEWIFTATATGEAIVKATVIHGAAIGTPYTQDFTVTVFPLFCEGDGTETNPYIICTAEYLALLATLVNEGNQDFNNKYYKLINDIDLSAYGATWNNGKGWIPIGTIGYNNWKPFKGVFDGNGKVITGLYFNNNTIRECVGLFGYVEEGTITNLGVENVNIIGQYSAGGMVGYAYNSSISNCYATGNVSGITAVGGIAGILKGSISNCYFSGIVSAAGGGGYGFGGLVGNAEIISISNCYSTGIVSGNFSVGGLVGEIEDPNQIEEEYTIIENCYSTANVSGTSSVGGLVGVGYWNIIIFNCVAANGAISGAYINRIVGYLDNSTLTNNYANEAMLVNGAIITTGAHNNENGVNVSLTTLTSLNFYNSPSNWHTAPWDIGTSTSIWAICENESLPHLRWQDIECTPVPLATQTIELTTGWNWVSTNVLNTSPSIMSQMQTSLSVVGELIKGYNLFSMNFGLFWTGGLEVISEKEMYLISVNSNHTMALTGTQADPATTSIPLNNGWNWIGYIPTFSAPFGHALAGAAPQTGDQIKNDMGYVTYFGSSWIGSIDYMNPGGGYQYFSKASAPKTFYYPSFETKSTILEYQPFYELKRTHHFGRYPSNMTVTAVVARDNKEILGDHLEIQAFSGNECRGSILMRYEELLDRYLGYLMIHGEGDEVITLRVFDHLTGKEYAVENSPFHFVTNQIVGGLDKPYIVNLVPETNTDIDELRMENGELTIYPNPTTGQLTIDNGQLTIDNVEVFDVYGRKVGAYPCGRPETTINISELPAGVYFLRIKTEQGEVVKKVVKQ